MKASRNPRDRLLTLIIGGSGFVGKYFWDMSRRLNPNRYIAPAHSDLDITNKHHVLEYFSNIRPRYVINFAAITNVEASEKERNNRKGKTWLTNYVGVKNLVAASKKYHSFFIQLSTDAVFSGTEDYSGPYRETDAPSRNGKGLNWYGLSKLMAEEEIKTMNRSYAIVRISHPFGNPASGRDLVRKTILDITVGHQIFADQLFTPTYLEDLVATVWKIQSREVSGIFHVGCKNVVARIEFDRYLAQKLKMKDVLNVGSLKEFLVAPRRAPRTRLGGFVVSQTQKVLGIKFHLWQDALDKTLRLI